ncbi:conjugal transfer protein TrbA [Achromobacter insuavis]|uniref:secretion/conjugation apparatus DotM-related subunit n=1 Tax=Achromobacter insuavis TaxID=1287735 RepID=UPI001F13A03E|nr:conjugal transfer protein TrbA [Achromobacter insuavis]
MTIVYLLLAAFFCGAMYALWYYFHTDIVYDSLLAAWRLLGLFDVPYLDRWIRPWRAEVAGVAGRPDLVSFDQLLSILNRVGYLFVGVPILMAARLYRKAQKHPANHTRRVIDASSLPWIMSKHAPAIIPVLYYGDLLNTDPQRHKSAERPEEWVAKHGLLVNSRLDRQRCHDLLAQDLGRKISTIQELRNYERALFAIFASRLFLDGKDRTKAQGLLDDLNRSCHRGTWEGERGYPDFEIVEAAFQKYASQPEVADWLNRHPYVTTLLHSMHLETMVRRTGGLPSSNFRWLKGIDRPLWYALNTSGRKTPFVESAAVFTQTLWERFADEHGHRLEEPQLDAAVDGIENYLIKLGLIEPATNLGDAK